MIENRMRGTMGKMKAIIFVICAAALLLAACGKGNEGPGGNAEEFDHFIVSESGMRAGFEAYEATRKGSGVLLEYYLAYPMWD